MVLDAYCRAYNKCFLSKFISNEALEMATNILDESKSTSINDLQVYHHSDARVF